MANETGKSINLRGIMPREDKLLVMPVLQGLQSKYIVIPDHLKDKPIPTEGIVLRAGHGRLSKFPLMMAATRGRSEDDKENVLTDIRILDERIPMDCKAGDRIVFERYAGAGSEFECDGVPLFFVKADHVMAILVPEPGDSEPRTPASL